VAAITPDSTITAEQAAGSFRDDASVLNAGIGTMGLKHVALPFLTTNAVDSGDTYTPGGWIGITRAAWEPATTGDESAVTITAATATAQGYVTFTGSTDNIEGYLHLWISN
jgi:hypothetical protein